MHKLRKNCRYLYISVVLMREKRTVPAAELRLRLCVPPSWHAAAVQCVVVSAPRIASLARRTPSSSPSTDDALQQSLSTAVNTNLHTRQHLAADLTVDSDKILHRNKITITTESAWRKRICLQQQRQRLRHSWKRKRESYDIPMFHKQAEFGVDDWCGQQLGS